MKVRVEERRNIISGAVFQAYCGTYLLGQSSTRSAALEDALATVRLMERAITREKETT